MKIEDGTGDGFWLKVGDDKRAFVRSMSELAIAVKSFEDGAAYQMFMPQRTLGGTSEHNMLYYKNTSETKSFAINKYWFGWNGGSTNFNRPCTIRQYLSPSVPSANEVVSGAGNLNTASGNAATMDVYYWDEVGTTGMTVASTGQQAGEGFVSQGNSLYELQGSTIIGPGDAVLVTAQSTEVGEFIVTIEGYFLD